MTNNHRALKFVGVSTIAGIFWGTTSLADSWRAIVSSFGSLLHRFLTIVLDAVGFLCLRAMLAPVVLLNRLSLCNIQELPT